MALDLIGLDIEMLLLSNFITDWVKLYQWAFIYQVSKTRILDICDGGQSEQMHMRSNDEKTID